MAQTALVDEVIDAGIRLVLRLSTTAFNPESALWLYRPESEDWMLMLGSTAVHKQGPRAGYELVQSVLTAEPFGSLRLEDVVITDNNDPFLRLLRTAITTGPGVDRIRFSRNRVGNSYIEDALIYRLQGSLLQPQSA